MSKVVPSSTWMTLQLIGSASLAMIHTNVPWLDHNLIKVTSIRLDKSQYLARTRLMLSYVKLWDKKQNKCWPLVPISLTKIIRQWAAWNMLGHFGLPEGMAAPRRTAACTRTCPTATWTTSRGCATKESTLFTCGRNISIGRCWNLHAINVTRMLPSVVWRHSGQMGSHHLYGWRDPIAMV